MVIVDRFAEVVEVFQCASAISAEKMAAVGLSKVCRSRFIEEELTVEVDVNSAMVGLGCGSFVKAKVAASLNGVGHVGGNNDVINPGGSAIICVR